MRPHRGTLRLNKYLYGAVNLWGRNMKYSHVKKASRLSAEDVQRHKGSGTNRVSGLLATVLSVAFFNPAVYAYEAYNDKPIGWPKFTGVYNSLREKTYVIVQDPAEVCEHETGSEGQPLFYRTADQDGAAGNVCLTEPPVGGEGVSFRPICMVFDQLPYSPTNPQRDGDHYWYRTQNIRPDNFGPGPFTCPAPDYLIWPVRDLSTGWVREADSSEMEPPPSPPEIPEPPKSLPDSDLADPTPDELGTPLAPGMCVGDPIVPATGEVLENIADYEENGVDPLNFRRMYRSQWSSGKSSDTSASPMGNQWSHNYSTSLHYSGIAVNIRMWDGAVRSFLKSRLESEWRPWGRHLDSLQQNLIGWQYRRADDGSTWLFDASGKLLSAIRRNGWTTTYTYSNGKLATVRNQFGRSLSFAYDTRGQVSSVSNLSGVIVDFQYDALGRLSEARHSDGFKRSYFYENAAFPDALTAINDEDGQRYVDFSYDSLGRAVNSQNFAGVGRFSVAYAGAGAFASSAVVTDPLGTERIYQYGIGKTLTVTSASKPEPGANDSIALREFTSSSYVETDFLGRKNLSYFTTDGFVGQKTVAINTPAKRTSTISWHPSLPLKNITTEPGKKVNNIYHGQPDPFDSNRIAQCSAALTPLPNGSAVAVLCKQVIQATYDQTGALGASAQIDTSVPTRVLAWTYDQDGQVITSRDPRGALTTRAYYSDNTSSHSKGDLRSITNAMGHITLFTAYDARGNLLTSLDPNGVSTNYVYDSRNRVKSISSNGEITRVSYKSIGKVDRVTFPDGSFLQYSYDPAHRLTSITDALGNTVTYNLDSMGNRLTTATKDPAGNLVRLLNRSIDSLGRVRMSTGAGE